MKKLMAGVCAAVCLPLFAETFTLRELPTTVDDWKNPAFYDEGAAPTGVAEDVIVIPLGMTVTVSSQTDAAVIAFLKSVGNIKVAFAHTKNGAIAKFVIDVAEGDTVEWPGKFYSYIEKDVAGNYSHVQKTGPGALKLTSQDDSAYQSSWVISEGELWLPSPSSAGYHYKYYGTFIVEENGTVRTDACTGNSIWQISGLYNRGVVQNESSASTTIYLGADQAPPDPIVCDGKFLGKLYFEVRCSSLDLLGVENTYSSAIRLLGDDLYGTRPSVLSVAKFGLKADAASSLGVSDPGVFISGDVGGRIIYKGTGETSNKDLRLIAGGESGTAPNEINGGEIGGLRLTGSFTKYDTSTIWNPLIIFSGDHTTPCTFAGVNKDFEFVSNPQSQCYGRIYTRYIKKTGTGEWYFPVNKDYTSGGTIAVTDGTLAFDFLDAKGRVCSLGKSTRCYDESSAQPIDDNRVDYAFLLGGDTDAETGILESRTNVFIQCTDRPFGLKGRGGFRANCGGVQYAKVFGINNRSSTLVLDGTNEFENVVCDVSDGNYGGSVSVEKNGSGTWVLGGDQTFSGSLTVNGGQLVVRRPAQEYRRYRLLVKEIVDNNPEKLSEVGKSHGNYSGVTVCEIGLWDADNRRVNMNLSYNPNRCTLQPGQCAYGWSLTGPTARKSELIYDGNRYTHPDSADGKIWGGLSSASFNSVGGLNSGATLSDPLTWIPFDMYLAEGEKVADHFDVFAGDTADLHWTVPTAMQLLASVDGIHWDEVSDVCTFSHKSTRYCWLSNAGGGACIDPTAPGLNSPDSSTFNRALGWKVTKTAPTKVFSLLNNVGAVTVANGATLKYEGASEEAPMLSSVKLASNATGSIDGFAFAENGTFEIDALNQGELNVAVSLPNATGLANVANWQVKVNGVVKDSCRVSATANGFKLERSGMYLIFK